jgi:amino acid transporter
MQTTTEEHGLKRELRLPDLVLIQVLLVVGFGWLGSTAVQGATHVPMWIAGIVLFYLPLAAVVMKLSRAIPVEGGHYQWIKQGISPFAGYIAVWNTSIYTIVVFGAVGPILVNSYVYIAGHGSEWMMTNTAINVAASVLCLLGVLWVNVRGLHMGKWITGGGSVLTIACAAIAVYLLIRHYSSGHVAESAPFSIQLPTLSILTLNVFTKMCIGALSGLESASVFASECRGAKNDLPRSLWLAAPLIALFYILGTGAMLAYIPMGKFDLAAPLQQLMRAGFGNAGLGQILTIVTVVALAVNTFAGTVAMVGMTARFPMVIGWDGILPEWWSELHPRYRTPAKSITMVTAGCIAVAFISALGGAGGQEIIQVGTNAGIAGMCISYVLMFSVVLFGKKLPDFHASPGLKLAAFSGFVVSLAALPFQILPLAGVTNRGLFAVKVGGLIVALNAGAAWLYWRGTRRLAKSAQQSR